MSYLISEGAAPSTPASGKVAVYAKTDGYVYSKDDAGNEYGPFLQNVTSGYTALSGATVDITGIPSWVTKITISIVGLSTNGTSIPIIQLGDSGGIEASGYLSAASIVASSSATTVNGTTGIPLAGAWAATTTIHGNAICSLADSTTNTWTISFVGGVSNIAQTIWAGGSKALSATLTQIRFTMVNGTDTFDAGSINVRYS